MKPAFDLTATAYSVSQWITENRKVCFVTTIPRVLGTVITVRRQRSLMHSAYFSSIASIALRMLSFALRFSSADRFGSELLSEASRADCAKKSHPFGVGSILVFGE